MPKVELIYDPDCPNVDAARANLKRSLTLSGLAPVWTEWDSTAANTPGYAKRYGSPSILVDGKDVAGIEPGERSASCRVYLDSPDQNKHIPSVEMIVTQLRKSSRDT